MKKQPDQKKLVVKATVKSTPAKKPKPVKPTGTPLPTKWRAGDDIIASEGEAYGIYCFSCQRDIDITIEPGQKYLSPENRSVETYEITCCPICGGENIERKL